MPSETIKFPTNVPVELVLKFDSGLECKSQFNGADQVMFTCEDDRRFYVSPAVAREIEAAGVRRGVPFTICKREKSIGQRRTTYMEVKRLDVDIPDEKADVPAKTTSANSSALATERNYLTAAAPASQFQSNGTGHANGNGHSNGNGNAGNNLNIQLISALLHQSGLGVIDAVARVEAHARELLGDSFQFGPENIQKLWVTAFIKLLDNGGRR
jgi:hypothetical protein